MLRAALKIARRNDPHNGFPAVTASLVRCRVERT
jgi:hypothetical protein